MPLLRALCICQVFLAAYPSNRIFAFDNWQLTENRDNISLFAESRIDSREVWSQLDQVQRELQDALGVKTSDEPIQVFVFRTHRNYLNSLVRRLPQARFRSAIYFRDGEVSQVFVWQSRSMLVDLRHEMVHVLLHQYLPFLPLWLDEGLAEYFEETPEKRLSSFRMTEIQLKAKVGITPSLNSLEKIPSADQMNSDDYRDSWAWACLLLNESEESRNLLRRYFAEIHRGEAPAAVSRFGPAEIPDFQRRANSYFRKMRIALRSD